MPAPAAEPGVQREGEALRAAARGLWAELYGEPLVSIVDR